MTDCLHRNVHIDWSIYHYVESHIRTAHFQAKCAECGVKFRFLGDMAIAPPTAQEALERRHGAWVSPAGDEMGVVIAAIAPMEPLETVEVEGRA